MMSDHKKRWEIYNLDLPHNQKEFEFDDYKFIKNDDQHVIAISKNGNGKENPSILWSGEATRLQDILLLYGFFARKLVCLKEKYGEDKYFYRPPGKKGISFSDSWSKTKKALDFISAWSPKERYKYQKKILGFHYLLAFRNERLAFVNAILMQTCLFECLPNSLGKGIWNGFLGISKEEYDLIRACWKRLRDCNVHRLNYTYGDFVTDVSKDPYQNLSPKEIKSLQKDINTEQAFNQFVKDLFWAFDTLLTYYFANFFGTYSLKKPPDLQDKVYLCLRAFFQSHTLNHKSPKVPIFRGK